MSVFLGYHYPCLDGISSACSAFLFFRDIQLVGATAQDFIEYIPRFESFEDINKPFYKWRFLFKEIQEEEVKASDYADFPHEYSPKILKDVVFLPCKLTSNGAFDFPYEQYSEEHLQKSVLILMDYSSGTASNIRNLCTTFLKVIILDHHLTFEHVLIELSQYGGIPSNLLFLYNKEKSGATVTFEFFEKLKGRPLIVNEEKYKNFQEVLSYVEDNDIRAGKVKNSAQFVSAIFKKKMNFNANENEDIFRDLIEANPEALIEIGILEEQERNKKSHEVVQNKHIVYLGGKTNEDTGKFGKCYGVKTEDLELRSEIGSILAELSIKDGLENMGFVYGIPENDMIKVSVRSIKGLPGGDCESVAREHQGGGHFNASGFHLSTTQFKEWI